MTSPNEFFGTLQQSVVEIWRKHLQTGKYSSHKALDEYYKNMPELIDILIEAWIGNNEKLYSYSNTILDWDSLTAEEGLSKLQEYIHSGYDEISVGDSEIESALDSVLELISGTIYKLRELKENSSDQVQSWIDNIIPLANYLEKESF